MGGVGVLCIYVTRQGIRCTTSIRTNSSHEGVRSALDIYVTDKCITYIIYTNSCQTVAWNISYAPTHAMQGQPVPADLNYMMHDNKV